MLRPRLSWIFLVAILALPSVSMAAGCHLTRFPPVPVTMEDLQPVIARTINGADARFLVDTADSGAAIELRPGDVRALYQRGLAEVRKGLKGQGREDLAAAQKLQSDIAQRYARLGLTP